MATTAIRERPVLMSGPMVKAILDGRKTMTRRVMKPQPEHFDKFPHWRWPHKAGPIAVASGDVPSFYAPWVPGDRLWVRETWAADQSVDHLPGSQLSFDHTPVWYRRSASVSDVRTKGSFGAGRRGRWRSSRFMPRWASRLTLEITDVRVQRVQDVNEADCIDEGCPYQYSGFTPEDAPEFVDWFRKLWDEINAKRGYGWCANPWVWVIGFRKVEVQP